MLEVQEKAVEADDSLWRTELTVPRSESTQEVAFYLRHKPVVDA